MVGLDSRRPPVNSNDWGAWKQWRVPVIVCLLFTVALVMKMKITEVALKGADVSTPKFIFTIQFILSPPSDSFSHFPTPQNLIISAALPRRNRYPRSP
jgi:hypothetical protein